MTPSAEGVICGIVSDLAVARANVRSCTETGGIALDGGKRHLRLEGRCVVPAGSSAHGLS